MHILIKKLLFVSVLIFSVSTQANGLEKEVPKASEDKTETSTEESAVDYNEVKDVFMPVKRIDNILTPKKKLRKKKYTIA
ncbi:hypothetical protein AXE80_09185 [Wenyingzhuangia fucanilytica]|uniref:Uncharacterized protein n=1 Tax=Wenyingzhuangia fucanilytica TaxID=1790137 RepID=A0A1B1Y6M6_9FLAO|nr:hypothetical protein [Wenyingzhuangia fucanilytica]ANW96441.1 hypothetical protein AXE80_09185 [Wenyingzhuangia fucanilytica]